MPKPKQKSSVVDLGEPNNAIARVTHEQVSAICHEIAVATPSNDAGYQPSFAQLFFFTLVRAHKESHKQRKGNEQLLMSIQRADDQLLGVDAESVWRIAHTVAQFLAEWGAVVSRLQQRNATEWELLRIQMEWATKRYRCPLEIKDDALHDALLKLFAVLDAMPTSQKLDMAPNVLTFFAERQATVMGSYDFSSPFYAYAQLIARNTLFYQLRRTPHEAIYSGDGDELGAEPGTIDHYAFEREEALLQLRLDLARLFSMIEGEMQRQLVRRQVVWHTLAARAQYWRALDETGLAPPIPLPPTPQTSDSDIAQNLAIKTVNAIRVHRRQAKEQITAADTASGALLEMLMDLDRSNRLEWPSQS